MESFVLDAPMYKRAISIDKSDVVTHSDDFDAPGKSIFRKFPKFKEKIFFEEFIAKREMTNSGVVHSATFFGKKPFGNFIFRKMFIWQHFIPKLLKSNELFGNKPN